MNEILERRLAGNPPLADLNPFEQVWDGAAKKIIHGMWHTEPVIDALTAIGAALQQGGKATFIRSGDQVIGNFAAKVYQKAFTAHINLVQSPSAADPSNSESFKAQVAWSRNTATERLAFWRRAAAEFSSAANCGSVEEKLKAIKNLRERLFPVKLSPF